MDMRMKREVLPPGVNNGSVPDRCSQIFFISGKLLKCFRHRPKQKIVAIPLVVVNQRIKLPRDSKHHMKITNIQKIGLSCVNPSLFGKCLALGAMTVAARVVGRLFISAAWATIYMPTEYGCPTVSDGAHGFILGGRKSVVSSIIITELFKNILHLRHLLLPSVYALAFWAAYLAGS